MYVSGCARQKINDRVNKVRQTSKRKTRIVSIITDGPLFLLGSVKIDGYIDYR